MFREFYSRPHECKRAQKTIFLSKTSSAGSADPKFEGMIVVDENIVSIIMGIIDVVAY